MNLNNLKVGGRYKNYKVLCEALEESSAGGKKKMYLLRKLAEHCDFSREGNAYIINEIYNRTTLNDISLTAKKGKVSRQDLFCDLLILSLSKREENTLIINTRNLIQLCGFVNGEYFNNSDRLSYYSDRTGLDKEVAGDVFQYSTRRLYSDVSKYLKKLESRRLIQLNNITFIEETIEGKQVKRKATNDENAFLLDCEAESLADLGLKYSYEIGGRWNQYIRVVYNKIKNNEEYNYIDKYYRMKEIILANKTLQRYSEESRERLIKSTLNNSIYVSFLKGCKYRHSKALNEFKVLKEEKEAAIAFGVSSCIKNEIAEKQLEIQAHENYIEMAEKILTDNIIIKDLSNNEDLELETKLDVLI